jgi:hypothetical protein
MPGGATARKANMNTIIRYRHWIYGARQTWPPLKSQKASAPPQAANELRAGESNEQSPPLVTSETPDSANSLNPSSKAPLTPPPRDTENSETSRKSGVTAPTKNVPRNDETLLTLIDSELFSNGQPSWEGGAEELQRELTKDGSACAREARLLLNWNGAAARYLGRLWRCHPERVQRLSHEDARRWRIHQADTLDT